MRRSHRLIPASLITFAVLLLSSTAVAQSIKFVVTQRRSFDNTAIEASAIEPGRDGEYLVADDEKADLLVLSSTGQVVPTAVRIPQPPANECDPTAKSVGGVLSGAKDWEAMAKDKADNYYLAGSHNLPEYWFIIQFNLAGPRKIATTTRLCLKTSLRDLGAGLSGPQIEGLAVQEIGGVKRLIFGIRERASTVVHVYQAILGSEPKLILEPFFAFEAVKIEGDPSEGHWHLSSIQYLPDRGYLILTSTERGSNFDGNALWFVSDSMLNNATCKANFRQVKPTRSTLFEPNMKAEGLYVISADDRTKIEGVMVVDNDGTAGQFWRVQINLGP